MGGRSGQKFIYLFIYTRRKGTENKQFCFAEESFYARYNIICRVFILFLNILELFGRPSTSNIDQFLSSTLLQTHVYANCLLAGLLSSIDGHQKFTNVKLQNYYFQGDRVTIATTLHVRKEIISLVGYIFENYCFSIITDFRK